MAALVVEEVRTGSGAEVPVGPGLAGNGVADVREPAADLADDVVGAVLVPGDQDARDPVVGDRAALVVGLPEHGVHAFQDPLGDGRGPPEPGRRRDDQDLRGEQLLVHARPVVPVAHVGRDPRFQVQVDGPYDVHLRPVAFERRDDRGGEDLGVGRLG